MKQAAIFLNGTYPKEHLAFYRRAIDRALPNSLVIAVDGGLRLFRSLGLTPHCALGDFDSVDRETLGSFRGVQLVEYPQDKNATDGELALRYALEQGCDEIDFFGAVDTRFETDQMFANFLLPALAKEYEAVQRHKIIIRLRDHYQTIRLLDDETVAIHGKSGDLISIVPLSRAVTLSVRGCKWELERAAVRFGQSLTLRNEMASDTAEIEVDGRVLVFHRPI